MPAAIHKNYQLVHRPPRLIQVKTPEIILISGPSKKNNRKRERNQAFHATATTDTQYRVEDFVENCQLTFNCCYISLIRRSQKKRKTAKVK
jgi:hypothetical protein